jgi:hypothetical protein
MTMTDNRSIPGPADRNFININQEHELTYWCKALGCTRAQLIAAVGAVGTSAAAVRRHLGK